VFDIPLVEMTLTGLMKLARLCGVLYFWTCPDYRG